MKQLENDFHAPQPRVAARAVVAWLFVLVAFVVISSIVCRQGEPLRPEAPRFAVRAPDDMINGVRISLVALLVSAAGALIYRVSFTRPSILALAVGLAIINLDPALLGFHQGYNTLLEQVRSAITPPPVIPNEDPTAAAATVALVAFARVRLYLLYYIGYVFWLIVILYSGYLGQYLASFALARKQEERRESARYVAERAGIGLSASVLAGVIAVFFASGLAAIIAREGLGNPALAWYFPPTVAQEVVRHRPATVKVDRAPGDNGAKPSESALKADFTASAPAPAPPATLPKAAASGPDGRDRGEDMARLFVYEDLERQRAYILITALSFFVGAYIVGLAVRPRTSTWVACGAVVAAMLLPAVALKLFLPPVEIESRVPVDALDDVVVMVAAGLTKLVSSYGTFFRLLEISPFTLGSTAVISSLAGDWAAKMVVKYRLSRQRFATFKPL